MSCQQACFYAQCLYEIRLLLGAPVETERDPREVAIAAAIAYALHNEIGTDGTPKAFVPERLHRTIQNIDARFGTDYQNRLDPHHPDAHTVTRDTP